MLCGVAGYETAYRRGTVKNSQLEEQLLNLDKLRFFFPDFEMKDFCMFEKIISLKWEPVIDTEDWTEHKHLFLEMDSADHYKILLECIDVVSLHFQGNEQVSGFYIRDMSERGYEKYSKYEVGDYEEDCIKFYCSDIVIKDLKKIH